MIKILIICLVLLPCFAQAGTYWVDPNGGAANFAACEGADPGAGNRCSVAQAMAGADDDDVVYFKGDAGNYNIGTASSWIAPTNSGSAGHVITFSAATGETPIFTQSNYTTIAVYGIYLDGKSYIKVTGLTFQDLTAWVVIKGGSQYNEISYCTFSNDTALEPKYAFGISIWGYVDAATPGTSNIHNWLHHNTAHGWGYTCAEGVDVVRIGFSAANETAVQNDNYNTVENNTFYHASHSVLDSFGSYTVIRNNTFHNEPWKPCDIAECIAADNPYDGCTGEGTVGYTPEYTGTAYDGKYGHRNVQLSEFNYRAMTNQLFEGNRMGFASTNPANAGPLNLDIAAPGNIVRYNAAFAGMVSGFYFKYAGDYDEGEKNRGGINNRVYNNTIFSNGIGYEGTPAYATRHGVTLYNSKTTSTGNVIKNNLSVLNTCGDFCGYTALGCSCSNPQTYQNASYTVVNNFCTQAAGDWCTASGDPSFVNTTLTTPANSATEPNLNLQAGSPAIDIAGGGALTTVHADDTGSGTSLILTDSLYFQAGSAAATTPMGSSLSSVQGDWIAVGTVSNVTQITDINYTTNTLTISPSISREDGQNVWLYRKSDGVTVLVGSAPDYGAYEYGGMTVFRTPWRTIN